jgi:hypothetical protein
LNGSSYEKTRYNKAKNEFFHYSTDYLLYPNNYTNHQ